MIFFILLAISITLSVPGYVCFYCFRKLPSMKFRQWQLLFFMNIILNVSSIFLSISLELFHLSPEGWKKSCVSLAAINLCLAVPWVGAAGLLRAFAIQFQYYWNQAKAFDHSKTDFFYRHRNFANPTKMFVYLVLMGSLLSLPIFTVLGTPESSPGSSFEECLSPFIFVNVAQMVPLMALFFFLLSKFLNFHDPFAIKYGLVLEVFLMGGTMVGYGIILLVQEISPFYSPGSYNPLWVFAGFSYLFPPFTLWFPLIYALYDEKKFLRFELLFKENSSTCDSSIADVLKNPTLLEAFSKVVAEHWCSEALLFLVEINRINSLPPSEYCPAAKNVAHEFILPDSRFQINIDQGEAAQIIDRVELGDFNPFLFENAVRDVSLQLEGVLLRWKTTAEYSRLILKSGSSFRSNRDIELRPLQPMN